LGNFDECFNAKKYLPLLVTACSASGFSISIATAPDANGNAYGATWNGIQPNCGVAGSVIGIT
jgi:hypothetical protein